MCKVHLSNGQLAVRVAKRIAERVATASSLPIAPAVVTVNHCECAGAWQRRSSSLGTGSHNGLFIQIILAMNRAKLAAHNAHILPAIDELLPMLLSLSLGLHR